MSNEDAANVAGIILVVLDILTVASRFYSRSVTKAGFGWDDWTILLALLFGILPGALTVWANSVSKTGPAAASNFNPDYVFTPADVLYSKITYSTSLLYFLATCTTKFSLLLLLHRIFAVSGSFRAQMYFTEVVVVAFLISTTVANLCDCIPLEWNWKNGNADPRYCINYNTFWLVTGIVESVIDLVILILPLRMVSKLQLNRKRKYGVIGLFLLGGLVLFSGVAKVVLSYLPNSREPNFSRAILWTTVHFYTGIIWANLPPSRPLFLQIAKGSTGLWMRASSPAKRWYSLNTSQPSSDHASMPQSTLGDESRTHHRPADVEVGQVNYELAIYGPKRPNHIHE